MEVDDPYRELGVTQDCSDAEVKAAWRRLAAEWHPDRNRSPAAPKKIQRINRALEEIRKARQMGRADAFDTDRPPPRQDEPPAPTAKQRSSAAGGATGAGGTTPLHHTVSLTLEQALAGCVQDLHGEVIEPCAQCAATGMAPQPRACESCGGSGQVRQPLWFGWVSSATECADCGGQGSVHHTCSACAGSGRTPPRSYRWRVRIPPGLRAGDQLQVPAQPRGRGGAQAETLTITIELQPHDFFVLEEDGTVRCEVPVDGFAWMAERWTEVPTPSGLQQMRLRRGHLVYRIKEQGFPARRGGARADCMVTVVPLFPDALSARQEAQIDRLIASHSGDSTTAAGRRVTEWQQVLAAWQQRLPEGAGAGKT